MNETTLYETLNSLSNQEFKDIIKTSPLQDYIDISFTSCIEEYTKRENNNIFKIKNKNNEEETVFIKYITLVDFLKFLIGKYKNDDLSILPCHQKSENITKYEQYINEPNNYAYVDSLFYHITSEFSKNHKFPHGIKCYDQFICKKKDCKINIADDLEYLCDSNFFNENINKLYYFDDKNISTLFTSEIKEKININETIELENIEELTEEPTITPISE